MAKFGSRFVPDIAYCKAVSGVSSLVLKVNTIFKGNAILMLSQNMQRCPHFQLHSEQLGLDGPAAYLAIRHCTLTARMLCLLEPSRDALPFAKRLVIQIDESHVYAFVGPDLEAVTQQTCSVTRCDQTCTPCYKQTLSQFGTVDPYEDTVTCNEEDDSSSDSVKRAASDIQPSTCC